MKIEDAFTKLLGRQATDEERMRLYRTRDALGLQDNDALWLLLIGLQYHQIQYEAMPGQIAREVNGILANAKKTAETEMMGTAVKIHGELVQSVANTAKDVANATAGKSMAQWALGAFGGAALVIIGALWFGHNWGYSAGKSEAATVAAWMTTAPGQAAYRAFLDDPVAAEWAGTRAAQVAFKLSKTDDLVAIAKCDRKGWTKEVRPEGTTVCVPRPDGKNIWGWTVPQ